MELYVGMDVSLKETSICVIDGDGEIRCEGTGGRPAQGLADNHQT